MDKRKFISSKPSVESPTKKKKERKIDYEESDDENNDDLISCEGNHIYFYNSVNTKSILQLIKHIKNLNIKLLSMQNDIKIKYNSSIDLYIYLHINSCGGNLTDAFAAINYIKKSEIPIISIIDGYAASAATLLSIVCNKRQITNDSCMLIHQLSSSSSGTFDQINDDHTNNILLQNKIKKIYIENSNSKLTNKKLDIILKQDLMWDANKCLENGLVDEII
jgi:ATP-dependent Clp protease, protease subunit